MKALLTLAIVALMSVSANADIHNKKFKHRNQPTPIYVDRNYYAPRPVIIETHNYRPWYGFGFIVIPRPVYGGPYVYGGVSYPSYGAYLRYRDECIRRDSRRFSRY